MGQEGFHGSLSPARDKCYRFVAVGNLIVPMISHKYHLSLGTTSEITCHKHSPVSSAVFIPHVPRYSHYRLFTNWCIENPNWLAMRRHWDRPESYSVFIVTAHFIAL